MASIFYDDVTSLVDKLTPEEQQALVKHVLEKPKPRKMTAEEFSDWLESISLDLGALLIGWSDRREDWYGDDGR
jgi:hypothetical protein